jgi:glucose/arabinose dehydrogenase
MIERVAAIPTDPTSPLAGDPHRRPGPFLASATARRAVFGASFLVAPVAVGEAFCTGCSRTTASAFGDVAPCPAGQHCLDAGGTIAASSVSAMASAAACNGSVLSVSTAGPPPTVPEAITVPAGFTIEVIASIAGARELAALPNGDLLVATTGTSVDLLPDAEADGAAGKPLVFTTIDDAPVQGITFASSSCSIYVASNKAVFRIAYSDGLQSAPAGPAIANVRTGGISGTDGDVHTSTSVAVAAGMLYVSVGSSCNACVESDPTRAAVLEMSPSGANPIVRATRFRNAIALATNPATQTLWAGGAGQDDLSPWGHPFEFFDAVTLHPGVADYGWPDCEENQHAYTSGADCSATVVPRIELPAYSTIIGAAFYPGNAGGIHAFSGAYAGGLFLAAHGSWHGLTSTNASVPYAPPRVAFVPMVGDAPVHEVDWTGETPQWIDFVAGFQANDGSRVGRPTGIAVGSKGSLFVADDSSNCIYRIRPH